MPKQTYFNLSDEKRKKVYEALLRSFKEKPVNDVTVKEIVLDLNIPRGSFYQYFDSINEAYFYVLEQELIEIHESFLNSVRENGMNIVAALDIFGGFIADEIFEEKNYMLYRNRYLSLDVELEKQWKSYRKKNTKYAQDMISVAEKEKTAFIGAVIHSLIQRLFAESWDRRSFLEHYGLYINWIKRGIAK